MRKKLLLVATATACVFGVVAAPLSASASVDFYDKYLLGDAGGASMNVSSNNASLAGNWWNDKVSSLWVWNPTNYVRIYEHANYQGDMLQFVNGTDNLGSKWGYYFDNKTSSYRLY